MVAVPIAIVVAVRTPASTVGSASGSCTSHRLWPFVMPSAVAAWHSPCGTSLRPVTVLRMMGSRAYSVSATSAGSVPMTPIKEISMASKASEGTVCSRPASPSSAARSRT